RRSPAAGPATAEARPAAAAFSDAATRRPPTPRPPRLRHARDRRSQGRGDHGLARTPGHHPPRRAAGAHGVHRRWRPPPLPARTLPGRRARVLPPAWLRPARASRAPAAHADGLRPGRADDAGAAPPAPCGRRWLAQPAAARRRGGPAPAALDRAVARARRPGGAPGALSLVQSWRPCRASARLPAAAASRLAGAGPGPGRAPARLGGTGGDRG